MTCGVFKIRQPPKVRGFASHGEGLNSVYLVVIFCGGVRDSVKPSNSRAIPSRSIAKVDLAYTSGFVPYMAPPSNIAHVGDLRHHFAYK